jgi:hypothetical protein
MEEIHKLNEYLAIKAKDEIIKENEYIEISHYLKKIAGTLSSLNHQLKITEQNTKLDLIELLLKEAKKDLEDFDTESPYLQLGMEQLHKLRHPFDD